MNSRKSMKTGLSPHIGALGEQNSNHGETRMKEILAAIDLETTGLDPLRNDIIEIAVQPLGKRSYRPLRAVPPLVGRIRARRPENATREALETSGLDPREGEEYGAFLARMKEWIEKNKIGKICPLGHNVGFDISFIDSQLPELGRLFARGQVRDSLRLACIYSELIERKEGHPAFRRLGLSSLRKELGIKGSKEHRALDDAVDSARIYRALLGRMDASLS